jgi:uncharacterized protein YkwD
MALLFAAGVLAKDIASTKSCNAGDCPQSVQTHSLLMRKSDMRKILFDGEASQINDGSKVSQATSRPLAQKGPESQFLLGPVVERFLMNVSSHPQQLLQVGHVSPDVNNLVSGQACPCTWNAKYPCSLWGSCYNLNSPASCNGYGGQFCGSAPSPTPSPPAPIPSPSSPTPSTPAPTPGGSLDTEMQAALDEHNRLRAKHQAPDLTWDDALASQAQSWAGHCNWEHSTLGNGENLWAGYGKAFSGAAAVKSWYDELTNPGYDFNNPGFSSGTGHFTQVVWKSTTRLGCAVHVCKPLKPLGWNPGNFLVCEYSPPGNYANQYVANVLEAN